MVCPSLISVSVAPGPYCFWASASGPQMSPTINPTAHTIRLRMMSSCLSVTRLLQLRFYFPTRAAHPHPCHPHETRRPARHQVDENQQENAVDRPGRGFGNLVGEVGHELDEQGAVEGTRNGGHPANDDANHEIDRQPGGKTVGRHELDDDRAERSGYPGVNTADAERKRHVQL